MDAHEIYFREQFIIDNALTVSTKAWKYGIHR